MLYRLELSRNRWVNTDKPFFWLRYQVKNGSGAHVLASMACKLEEGAWQRDKATESLAVVREHGKRVSRVADRMEKMVIHAKRCKLLDSVCHQKVDNAYADVNKPYPEIMKKIRRDAEAHVFDGVGAIYSPD